MQSAFDFFVTFLGQGVPRWWPWAATGHGAGGGAHTQSGPDAGGLAQRSPQ